MVRSICSRSAFSLIELVFAIVIIAISVASIPIMTNAIGKGIDNNIIQETIFAATAEMNQILSYRWDENSIDETLDINATGLAQVISRDGTYACINKVKIGHIAAQPLHRRCLDNNTTRVSTIFGPTLDGTELEADDLDDFNGSGGNLFTGDTSSEAYKRDYTYKVSVNLSDMDGEANVTDEAKEVIVSVYMIDDNGNNVLVSELNSYTFNIGEIDYHKRMYP